VQHFPQAVHSNRREEALLFASSNHALSLFVDAVVLRTAAESTAADDEDSTTRLAVDTAQEL
jgi:hypothetical protein